MEITVSISGTTALVLHNPRLVDPLDPITRAIAEITAKGAKKTDADHAEIGRLEWEGGLYRDPDGDLALPAFNVVSALADGATMTKNGASLFRGVVPHSPWVAVVIDPPKLKMTDATTWRASVVNGGRGAGRVMRTRPRFHDWSLVLSGWLDEEELNLRALKAAVDRAGRLYGIGDARKLGYGRFTAEVSGS